MAQPQTFLDTPTLATLQGLTGKLTSLKDRIAQEKTSNDAFMASARDKIQTISNACKTIVPRMRAISDSVAAKDNQIAQLTRERDQRVKDLTMIQGQLKESERQIQALQVQQADAERARRDIESQIVPLQRQQAQSENEKRALEQQLAPLQNAQRDLTAQLAQVRGELDAANLTVQSFTQQRNDIVAAIGQTDDAITTINNEVTALNKTTTDAYAALLRELQQLETELTNILGNGAPGPGQQPPSQPQYQYPAQRQPQGAVGQPQGGVGQPQGGVGQPQGGVGRMGMSDEEFNAIFPPLPKKRGGKTKRQKNKHGKKLKKSQKGGYFAQFKKTNYKRYTRRFSNSSGSNSSSKRN